MLIDKVKIPKIIDDFAKFDGRRKKYVPYPIVFDASSDAKKREILLLTELQTRWEQLHTQYPGNIRFLKSTAKYYQQL